MPEGPTPTTGRRQDRIALIVDLIDRVLADCGHQTAETQLASSGGRVSSGR